MKLPLFIFLFSFIALSKEEDTCALALKIRLPARLLSISYFKNDKGILKLSNNMSCENTIMVGALTPIIGKDVVYYFYKKLPKLQPNGITEVEFTHSDFPFERSISVKIDPNDRIMRGHYIGALEFDHKIFDAYPGNYFNIVLLYPILYYTQTMPLRVYHSRFPSFVKLGIGTALIAQGEVSKRYQAMAQLKNMSGPVILGTEGYDSLELSSEDPDFDFIVCTRLSSAFRALDVVLYSSYYPFAPTDTKKKLYLFSKNLRGMHTSYDLSFLALKKPGTSHCGNLGGGNIQAKGLEMVSFKFDSLGQLNAGTLPFGYVFSTSQDIYFLPTSSKFDPRLAGFFPGGDGSIGKTINKATPTSILLTGTVSKQYGGKSFYQAQTKLIDKNTSKELNQWSFNINPITPEKILDTVDLPAGTYQIQKTMQADQKIPMSARSNTTFKIEEEDEKSNERVLPSAQAVTAYASGNQMTFYFSFYTYKNTSLSPTEMQLIRNRSKIVRSKLILKDSYSKKWLLPYVVYADTKNDLYEYRFICDGGCEKRFWDIEASFQNTLGDTQKVSITNYFTR